VRLRSKYRLYNTVVVVSSELLAVTFDEREIHYHFVLLRSVMVVKDMRLHCDVRLWVLPDEVHSSILLQLIFE
jgi:hypothetical protein